MSMGSFYFVCRPNKKSRLTASTQSVASEAMVHRANSIYVRISVDHIARILRFGMKHNLKTTKVNPSCASNRSETFDNHSFGFEFRFDSRITHLCMEFQD